MLEALALMEQLFIAIMRLLLVVGCIGVTVAACATGVLMYRLCKIKW